MKRFSLLLAFLLAGCASQIMQSYVGKDLREAILDYGPPSNAMDMGDGTRAFQWAKKNSVYVPPSSTTTGSVNSYGNSAFFNANTRVSGGYVSEKSCNYTLIARHNKKTKAWIVEGFRKPTLMCE